MRPVSASPGAAPRLYSIDLNTTDPVAAARRLGRNVPERPRLLIDCRRLNCLRTHGVSYLASQLLLTRQAGADVLLYNVGPVLERALRLLRLDRVFELWPAERPALGVGL